MSLYMCLSIYMSLSLSLSHHNVRPLAALPLVGASSSSSVAPWLLVTSKAPRSL